MAAAEQGSGGQYNRMDAANSIAAGLKEFAARPGTTVRVVAKTAPEWREYVHRVWNTVLDTQHLVETFRQAMPEHQPAAEVLSQQRAAVDALAHEEAEYAVVAEDGGNGPLTVVTLTVAGDRLVVVGGGTTFLPRVPEGATLPIGEQAGCAVRYALATLAVQQSQAVENRVPAGSWYGQQAGPSWSVDDVQFVAEMVVSLQPDGADPYPEVSAHLLGTDEYRRWATQLDSWVESGGGVEVYDHADEEQHEVVEQLLLSLDPSPARMVEHPIPQRPGVRTIVVTMNGEPQGAVTVGHDAAGDLHVLQLVPSADAGANRAAELMMYEAAIRAGGGVSFAPQSSASPGQELHAVSALDSAEHAGKLRGHLDRVNPAGGIRMWKLIKTLDDVSGRPAAAPAVDPAVLAARVQAFRVAGGDVLVFGRSDPAFAEWQGKAADRMAAAMGPDGTVPPDVDGLWRVFNPPAVESGGAAFGEPRVAIAVVDGVPVAAAAVNGIGSRLELGVLGAVSGADDGLVAAVVDGVYPMALKSREPLTMLRGDEEAARLASFGLEVTGVHPVDDQRLVQVQLSKDAQRAISVAVGETGWARASQLNFEARALGAFQEQKHGSVRRLDHGVAAERAAAEEAIRTVQDRPDMPQPDSPVPPVNGERFTVLAQCDESSAYISFDETPDGRIEVVDVAASSFDDAALSAARHAFCNQLAERGQDAALHSRITGGERDRNIWDKRQGQYYVTGVRNRLGAELAESLLPAPEPTATPEASQTTETAQITETAQTTEAGQGTEAGPAAEGGQTPGSGQGEVPRRRSGGPHHGRGPER
ncbi:hypothetical protein [Kribbella solani]|uniref:hypothetical protein n=1 Tax=Kribbella solani TaxID=236067 RepID=UPI0029AB8B76|nr:hypothetical protein [Kribbella solani]MDX2968692.1 hypothetical protein [Kribbella solani]